MSVESVFIMSSSLMFDYPAFTLDRHHWEAILECLEEDKLDDDGILLGVQQR